jgi:RNA polymerase sigma-32 factor
VKRKIIPPAVHTMLQQCTVLSHEEMRQEVFRAQSGDKRALDKVVRGMLKMVLANIFRRPYKGSVEDLMQEGAQGVMQAVRLYDHRANCAFSSYASWWINSYLLLFDMKNAPVRSGRTQWGRKFWFSCSKYLDIFAGIPGLDYAAEFSEIFGVSREEIDNERFAQTSPSWKSLDQSAYNVTDVEHSTRTVEEIMTVVEDEPIEERLVRMHMLPAVRKAIHKFMESLDDRQMTVFQRRIFTANPTTLLEIAETQGVTRERIRQIECKLVDKLDEQLKAEGLVEDSVNIRKIFYSRLDRNEAARADDPPRELEDPETGVIERYDERQGRVRILEFNGKRQSVKAWADELNIPPMVLYKRLAAKKSIEETLTMPYVAISKHRIVSERTFHVVAPPSPAPVPSPEPEEEEVPATDINPVTHAEDSVILSGVPSTERDEQLKLLGEIELTIYRVQRQEDNLRERKRILLESLTKEDDRADVASLRGPR